MTDSGSRPVLGHPCLAFSCLITAKCVYYEYDSGGLMFILLAIVSGEFL
jgi:hypothetical protein